MTLQNRYKSPPLRNIQMNFETSTASTDAQLTIASGSEKEVQG